MNLVRSIRRSQFLRHNAVFLLGAVIVGALNYLYYPVVGRSLSPSQFGEVQTLVSLFLQLCVFLVVLSTVIVRIVTNYPEQSTRNAVVFEFEKLASLASLLLLVVCAFFGSAFESWLNFSSAWPFMVLALAVVASVPFTLRGAFLRGQQKFGLVSAGNIIFAGGKLLLSAVLIVFGFGTIGALWGVVAAQIIACGAVVWWTWRLGLSRPPGRRFGLPRLRLLAPELRYGLIILIASLAITLQYSIDIIVVKHYFDARVAGLYAGIAAVARIIFFLTAPIAQVLLSKVRLDGHDATNRQLLYKSVGLIGLVSLPVLIVCVGFPAQAIGTLMGGSYRTLAPLLPRLTLSIFIVSVLNVLAAYFLALRRSMIALALAGGAVLTYLLIFLYHGSPAAVVNNLLIGSSATLVLVGVWQLTERRYGAWRTKIVANKS